LSDKPSAAAARQKDLLLDMPPEWTPRRALIVTSARVARHYAAKSAKTLTRDLNALLGLKLIVRSGTSYKPNRERILAFLPPVLPRIQNPAKADRGERA